MTEMAELLRLTVKTINMRLFRAGIKPITKEALYDKSALETIRNVAGKGRPRKSPAPESVRQESKGGPAKKGKK